VSRSRREKREKVGRTSALEQLRKAKKGEKIKYEVMIQVVDMCEGVMYVRRGGSRLSRPPTDFLLPSNTLQLLLGDPKAIPGQIRYIIPPAGSGSAPGSPASRMCPENL